MSKAILAPAPVPNAPAEAEATEQAEGDAKEQPALVQVMSISGGVVTHNCPLPEFEGVTVKHPERWTVTLQRAFSRGHGSVRKPFDDAIIESMIAIVSEDTKTKPDAAKVKVLQKRIKDAEAAIEKVSNDEEILMGCLEICKVGGITIPEDNGDAEPHYKKLYDWIMKVVYTEGLNEAYTNPKK